MQIITFIVMKQLFSHYSSIIFGSLVFMQIRESKKIKNFLIICNV